MSVATQSAENPAHQRGTDPELSALPKPRRPWRRVALATMALTLAGSALLSYSLLPQLRYALSAPAALELGPLQDLQLTAELANRLVHGTGELQTRAISYRRPLTPGEYRMVPLVGNDRIWVELRIPGELDAERFIPPTSFVGRLVPLAEAGLNYPALAETNGGPALDSAWLLLDGESPQGTRWVFGVLLVLFGFAGFSGYGLYRVLKRYAAS